VQVKRPQSSLLVSSVRLEHDYFRYHPMPEITDWMWLMVKDHPDLVTVVDYGRTHENRTISLLKIGLDTGLKKKAVWMDCGIHAREWIAPAFCQYFVRQILQTSKTDPKMELMMKNLDFYVTPVFNVDGYVYSWKDNTVSTRLWRKNRSASPPGCDCQGTDLNRNFDSNWGTVRVSSDCCSNRYGGTGPMSEPETQFLTYFVGSRKDDFLCFLTIHSYGQQLLFPYGHPNFTASNYAELMEVGLAAAEAIQEAHGMIYEVGTPSDILYSFSGSSQDWAHMVGIPLAFTFELRDNGTFGFELPEDLIQPTCEEAYSGVLHIITYAHDKAFSAAAPAATAAAAAIWTVLFAAGTTTVSLM
uniref:Carboxypeptidase O n=1 Tax=Salarias fasciatus TaxID=181472 RepID=A0A672IWD4_SALFA